MATSLKDEDSLLLLEAVLRERGVDYNHINSYDSFVENELRSLEGIVIAPVPLRDGTVLHFRFGNLNFRRPPTIIEDDLREVELTPRLAKQRKENYCARTYVDIHIYTLRDNEVELTDEVIRRGLLRRRRDGGNIDVEDYDDGIEELDLSVGVKHRVQPMVYLTAFPVMVGSRLCALHGKPVEELQRLGEAIFEPGGYFIMRGKERVIVPQKNMSKNTLFITTDEPSGNTDPRKISHVGTMHCCGEDVSSQRVVNRIIVAHEKEIQDTTVRVAITQLYAGKGIPLSVLLAALGMSDWQTIIYNIAAFARLDMTTVTRMMQGTEALSREVFNVIDDDTTPFRAAWNWISERVSSKQRVISSDPLPRHPTEPKKTASYEVVHNWLLPHVMDGLPAMRTEQDYWAVCRVKALMLCNLTGSVLRVALGLDEPTNKDSMENKVSGSYPSFSPIGNGFKISHSFAEIRLTWQSVGQRVVPRVSAPAVVRLSHANCQHGQEQEAHRHCGRHVLGEAAKRSRQRSAVGQVQHCKARWSWIQWECGQWNLSEPVSHQHARFRLPPEKGGHQRNTQDARQRPPVGHESVGLPLPVRDARRTAVWNCEPLGHALFRFPRLPHSDGDRMVPGERSQRLPRH